jgi:hypothetical protein
MTSIEFLFKELWETSKDKFEWHSILEKAKEMYKEEIIESYSDGRESSEHYYKEKLKQNNG